MAPDASTHGVSRMHTRNNAVPDYKALWVLATFRKPGSPFPSPETNKCETKLVCLLKCVYGNWWEFPSRFTSRFDTKSNSWNFYRIHRAFKGLVLLRWRWASLGLRAPLVIAARLYTCDGETELYVRWARSERLSIPSPVSPTIALTVCLGIFNTRLQKRRPSASGARGTLKAAKVSSTEHASLKSFSGSDRSLSAKLQVRQVREDRLRCIDWTLPRSIGLIV